MRAVSEGAQQLCCVCICGALRGFVVWIQRASIDLHSPIPKLVVSLNCMERNRSYHGRALDERSVSPSSRAVPAKMHKVSCMFGLSDTAQATRYKYSASS